MREGPARPGARDDPRWLRHASPVGAWEEVVSAPDGGLGEVVLRYQGYTEHAASFSARRELPTAGVVLILSFGASSHVTDPRHPGRVTSVRSMCAGVWDSYAVSGLDPGWSGVQVDLSPLGAYALFGVPMSELANRVVPLEDLMGGKAALLVERVQEAA